MNIRRALLACVGLLLALNFLGLIISVAGKMPAEFGGVGDPDNVAGEFVTRGTLLAAPLTILIVLAIFTLFAWRGGRWLGGLGMLVLAAIGVLFTIGNLGEPLRPQASNPPIALLLTWRALGVGLSVALALISVVGLFRRVRPGEAAQQANPG